MCKRSCTVLLFCCALSGQGTSLAQVPYPEPDPPREFLPATDSMVTPQALLPAAAPTIEWTYHRSADMQHPNGEEQEQVWLINRARQDPTAEGIWLATETDRDVAFARDWFGVDLNKLMSEFAAIAPKPPAAFDSRLYEAAKLHSDDLIARDAQDHNNQFSRISAAGFNYRSARGNVFSYAANSLNAHAGFNIDWGNEPDGMQTGRGHRKAIMSIDGDFTNVGLASVVETSVLTSVGERVVTQNFAEAWANGVDHFNRFIVGTVWEDINSNGRYDAGEGYPGVMVEPDKGTYYAVTSAGGGYAIPIETADTYQVTFSGGGIGQADSRDIAVGAESVLLDYEVGTQPPPGTVDLDGFIENLAGTPLCTMVLASGQYMFSCNPDGEFSLTNLPTEPDGTIKLQVYADGFRPHVATLNSFPYQSITMVPSGNCPDYNSHPAPGVYPNSAGNWIDISGQVRLQDTATPVCAMTLANGQYMFSCDGSGSYNLRVPLDANGQVKLQVYADGFAPYVLLFDEYNTSNTVRLARDSECQ